MCADLLMTTSPNVLVYAAMDGWRRQMAQHGAEILGAALAVADRARRDIEAVAGLEVMDEELIGAEASHELDRLQVLFDVSATGATGYVCADWLRREHRLDVGLSDHRRILATFSLADTRETATRLVRALRELPSAAADFSEAPRIDLPDPANLSLRTVMTPRDAFFGETECIPAARAVGRAAAEQITPYPPDIPAVVPGEELSEGVIDYLTTGVAAGMNIPDAADTSLETFRVVR